MTSYISIRIQGLDTIPPRLRNGEETVLLEGSQVESRGKATGITSVDDWKVNVHLQMHGHVVVITAKELRLIDNARLEDPDSEMGKVTIQLALINEDYEGSSLWIGLDYSYSPE